MTKFSPTQLQHHHHHHSYIISKLFFFFFLMLLSISTRTNTNWNRSIESKWKHIKQTTNRHGAAFSTHLVANLNMVELEYSMTRKGRIICLQWMMSSNWTAIANEGDPKQAPNKPLQFFLVYKKDTLHNVKRNWRALHFSKCLPVIFFIVFPCDTRQVFDSYPLGIATKQ